jgi:hypothetical protein
MISNPKYGWCKFKLGDFEGHPSYLTNVPLELLNAFVNYYTQGYGVAVFDEEGSCFTLLLTRYNWGIFIIEEKNESVLYDFSDMDIDDLTKELINDIESDLNGWMNFTTDEDWEEIAKYGDEIKEELYRLKDILFRQGVKL